MTPFVRVPYHGPVVTGSQDQDNFIRDLVTILFWGWWPFADGGGEWPTSSLSASAKDLPPVLTLPEIKLHCRIEPDQTAEDSLLVGFEMAARLHTQRVLRRTFDATVGENVKQAMLMLIAYWYRSREAVIAGSDKAATLPLAYTALLQPERDFPPGTY